MLGKKKREEKTQQTKHPNKISSPFWASRNLPYIDMIRASTWLGFVSCLEPNSHPPGLVKKWGSSWFHDFGDSRGRLKNDLFCTWQMFLGDECDFFSGKKTRKNKHTHSQNKYYNDCNFCGNISNTQNKTTRWNLNHCGWKRLLGKKQLRNSDDALCLHLWRITSITDAKIGSDEKTTWPKTNVDTTANHRTRILSIWFWPNS